MTRKMDFLFVKRNNRNRMTTLLQHHSRFPTTPAKHITYSNCSVPGWDPDSCVWNRIRRIIKFCYTSKEAIFPPPFPLSSIYSLCVASARDTCTPLNSSSAELPKCSVNFEFRRVTKMFRRLRVQQDKTGDVVINRVTKMFSEFQV